MTKRLCWALNVYMNKDRPIDIVQLVLLLLTLAGVVYMNIQTYENNKAVRADLVEIASDASKAAGAAQQAARNTDRLTD